MFFDLDDAGTDVGAMIRNAFKTGENIQKGNTELKCADVVLQTLDVLALHLTAQIIDHLF